MLNFLTRTFTNFTNDKAQVLRLRRIMLAMIGGLILSIICYILLLENILRVTNHQFHYMLILFWIGNLIFPFLVISGFNRKLKDPSLTTVQMLWAITTTMIAIYFLTKLRTALLMMVLLVIMFGSLNYSQIRLLIMIAYSIICYIAIIFLLKDIPSANLDPKLETIVLFIYSLVSLSYSILARELIGLRKHMKEKTGILSTSLNRVEMESLTDPLTGIGNRRYLEHILELQQSLITRKENYYLTLCMLDLDHFKNINDSYGHEIGDKVLKKFSTIISHILRKSDHFGRFGGEEFIIVSPFTTIDEITKIAERILISIQDTSVVENDREIKFTVSIGITMYYQYDSIETVLKRVDQALYRAKEKGRNQIAIM